MGFCSFSFYGRMGSGGILISWRENGRSRTGGFAFGSRHLGHFLVEIMTGDVRRAVFICDKRCSGHKKESNLFMFIVFCCASNIGSCS